MSGHYQSQPPYLRVSLPLVSRLGLMQLSEPPPSKPSSII